MNQSHPINIYIKVFYRSYSSRLEVYTNWIGTYIHIHINKILFPHPQAFPRKVTTQESCLPLYAYPIVLHWFFWNLHKILDPSSICEFEFQN